MAEAGVLALLAEIASAMVLRRHQFSSNLGPVGLHLEIGTALLIAFAFAGVRLMLGMVIAWLPSRISADVQASLRSDLFGAFIGASWSLQAAEAEGHLQELMTNQIMQATAAVINLATAVSACAMFLTLVATAFLLNVVVAFVVLVISSALFCALASAFPARPARR